MFLNACGAYQSGNKGHPMDAIPVRDVLEAGPNDLSAHRKPDYIKFGS